MNIVFLAFNYGYAGATVNGPGMCLFNFINFIKQEYSDINIKIYTKLRALTNHSQLNIYNISDHINLTKDIMKADIVHHWSGLVPGFKVALEIAHNFNKKIIIGPNLIDTVEMEKEQNFLNNLHYFKMLVVNKRLKFKIAKDHNIPLNKLEVFQVGPDIKLWKPSKIKNDTILWKGNSNQHVKDVNFALAVKDKLRGKYRFKFFGYPKPYDYFSHIDEAKKSKLIIVTSLSETMGLALAESWAAGIPSITHPKIYLHGKNYETGIITNKTVNDYVKAINEIMKNEKLYSYLSLGCRTYMENNFSAKIIVTKYIEILNRS